MTVVACTGKDIFFYLLLRKREILSLYTDQGLLISLLLLSSLNYLHTSQLHACKSSAPSLPERVSFQV